MSKRRRKFSPDCLWLADFERVLPASYPTSVDVNKIRIGVVAHAAAFKGTSQVPELDGFEITEPDIDGASAHM